MLCMSGDDGVWMQDLNMLNKSNLTLIRVIFRILYIYPRSEDYVEIDIPVIRPVDTT